ncbi:MAG: DUF4340 domain-containing protein, partial [Candidatus Rokubacteria bacterium]|nr:DUF4340 domain-containing protein [Candidatus Rokubacteria bacterium]
MSWKTGIVLAVVLAALGGFVYYDTYWLTPARDKTTAAQGRLWTVEPKDIEALTIKRKGETIRARRVEGGGWELSEPIKGPGDRGVLDEIVTSLATLRMDREIDGNPSKLAEFGLDPPEVEVVLQVKDRAERLVLLVGDKNPTGAWVYGKEATKPAVLALGEIVSRDTTRPLLDFRDKTVIVFDRKSVTGLTLESGSERIALETEDDGKWKIVRPGPYPADADLVRDFLDKLERARAKAFVAETGTALAQYGLDKPARARILIGKDNARSSKEVLFGRVDAEKKGVYVRRDGDSPIMLVGDELWAAYPKTVAALRDKVVLAYAYDKVAKLEVDHAKGRVVLERDGTGWKVTAPEALKADTSAVNALLWSLRDLRALGFLADDAAAIPRYLAKPAVTVRVWEEGATEPRTLLLAPS